MKKKDQILLEQAYGQVQVKENSNDSELNNAFNTLQKSLELFYALGQKGLNADADAANERIIDMLRMQGVDEKDLTRFGNALTSIVLGQSMSGYASREQSASDEYEHKGWPGDGSGEDDFADYNQNEGNDY